MISILNSPEQYKDLLKNLSDGDQTKQLEELTSLS